MFWRGGFGGLLFRLLTDLLLDRQDTLQRHWDKYCRKKPKRNGDERASRRGRGRAKDATGGKGKQKGSESGSDSEVDELESEDPLDGSENEARVAHASEDLDEEEIDELAESDERSDAEGVSVDGYETDRMNVDVPRPRVARVRPPPDPRPLSAPATIAHSFTVFKPLLPKLNGAQALSSLPGHPLPPQPLRRPIAPVNGYTMGRPILPAPPGYEVRNTVYPVRPNPTGRRKAPALLKGFTSTFPAQPAKDKKGKPAPSPLESQQQLSQHAQGSSQQQRHQQHAGLTPAYGPPLPVTFPPIQQSSYATTSAIPTTITIPPSDPSFHPPSNGSLRHSSNNSNNANNSNANNRRGPKPRRNDFDAVLDPSQTAAQGGQIRMRVLPQATYMPPVQPALAIMHEQPHVVKRKGKRMDGLVPEYGFVPREYVYRERGSGERGGSGGGGAGD